MEEDEKQIETKAEVKTGAEPVTEIKQETGPTREELEAQVRDLGAKYERATRQIGERDTGLKRLTNEKEQLKRAIDALARNQYGVTESEPSAYDEFRKKYLESQELSQPAQGPVLTTEQQDATDELMEILAGAGLNPYKPPEELNPQVQLAGYYLGRHQFEKARVLMDKAVKSYQDKQKTEETARTEATKAKAEATKKVAEEGRTARIGSPGGGPSGTFESVRDAFIANPRDPVVRARYFEMRQERRGG